MFLHQSRPPAIFEIGSYSFSSIDDAREIILYTEKLVAPVAWALFTEKTTWDELLFSSVDNGTVVDKAQQLAALIHQGRCVIMDSKTQYH